MIYCIVDFVMILFNDIAYNDLVHILLMIFVNALLCN